LGTTVLFINRTRERIDLRRERRAFTRLIDMVRRWP